MYSIDDSTPLDETPNNPTKNPDVPLPDFREEYIADISTVINNGDFVCRHCNQKNGKGFTRKRKLSFIYLILLLTQGLSRSIQRELNSFYQKLKGADFSIQEVTKSAFTHARSKLKPEAFIELNRIGIESFYKNAPYLKWQGFRLLSIDGSTIMLPNHPTIEKEFGSTNFGAGKGKPRPLARISMLYDVLNFTTLNAEISGFDISERELARDHFKFMQPGQDLVILDRGYPSLSLFFELQQLKIDYCVRMQGEWWIEVRKMVQNGEKDKVVTFKLSKKDDYFPEMYNTTNDEVTCRLVVITLPNGENEVLCTSVLDNDIIPYESFKTLYHYRWNIEEGYKLYKCRIQLEDFSGKTVNAVLQDFYAKVFMMTTTAVMAFPIEEKLKKEQQNSSKKHAYKVNRTNALSMIREITGKLFMNKTTKQALQAFDDFLKKTVEIVRPNRKVPRKPNKKKPPSMNYKQL